MPPSPKSAQLITPIVVKLGGSLYNHVPKLAEIFSHSCRPLLIVPGGGHFADSVRAMQLADDDAHWSAIEAMDNYGRYIATFGFETTDRIQIPENTIILLPFRCTRHFDPLPHSWDVTSDTIAAWVAGRLGLDLLVLKSVHGIRVQGIPVPTLSHPVETEDVDPCFIPYVLHHRVTSAIINGTIPDIVDSFLRGERVPGTRICTTF